MPLLRGRVPTGGRGIGRRLTIAQLVPALEGGGVEQGTLEIAEALVAAGHRSIVISAGGRMVEQLVAAGSEHHALPIGAKSPRSLAQIPRLQALLRRLQPDVVHARSRLPAWIARTALRGLRPRPVFVTTLHGLNSVSRYSAVMTQGDMVIAVSETARCYWLEHYPSLRPERVRVIHRGIDPQRFPYGHEPAAEWAADFRRGFDIAASTRLITLPGRISRGKGHATLIRALPELPDDTVALMVGAGSARHQDRLEQLAVELDVADRVVFTGQQSAMPDILALSIIVVAPASHPESFGRTVAEALALGRPVVGFDHGGVGEILAEIYPEGAVPTGDEEAFVERLRRYLDAGSPTVPDRQPFLTARMQRETLDLYEEIADVPADDQS